MATPDDTRLLLDAMLGKLATYLRMCGYDAAYALDRGVEEDAKLRTVAAEEGRVLLTRDRALAARHPGSVSIESRDVTDQLRELVDDGFDLELAEPGRCAHCNGRLEPVDPTETTPEFAPDPDDREVWRCVDCGQPFWRGSHWEAVERTLASL